MQYISNASAGTTDTIRQIKEMVLATNPLLESFGCAKTLRNNNSSRHGKYWKSSSTKPANRSAHSSPTTFLEKARVVGQIANERNFHIFYQLTKAAPKEFREKFGLSGPDAYIYTGAAGCLDVDGIDDVADYEETIKAMNVIGITKSEQENVFRMLSIIIWLGNVQFEGDTKASIVDRDVVSFIAHLLQVDSGLLQKVFMSRIMETKRGGQRGTVYDVPLNAVQAGAVRDALAKAIYDRLFEWIISRVNHALEKRSQYQHIIGILDIYGFEIFDKNSFEQLCINYVNEKLQQIFIELTLKTEQEEYVREKIQWTPIDFFNNKVVCDLIEEKKPPGVFAALNDACATAHADSSAADNSFVQRLGALSSNQHFSLTAQTFLIRHYAGDVNYVVTGMTDKNKDQLVQDILDVVKMSRNAFVLELFPDQVDPERKKRPPTASDRIKTSAGTLVGNLMACRPSYIRCIKSNANKSPTEYDQKMCLHQVKYLGLCENVRIRTAGYASRQTFEKFLERFYLLSPRTCYAGEYISHGDARGGSLAILQLRYCTRRVADGRFKGLHPTSRNTLGPRAHA